MLRVTIDLFSGRPNPTWFITDPDATEQVLAQVADAPALVAAPGAGYTGLGFRELTVAVVGDDPRRKGVPPQFALASTASEDFEASGELARRLIGDLERYADIHLPSHDLTPLNREIRDLSLEHLARYLRDRPSIPIFKPRRGNPLITTTADPQCRNCHYEISQYNPGFWNAPAAQPHNNCYNYARNWRTDTFAQPGRAHGAGTNVMSCPTVTAAALADGLHRRCDCLPDSEYPRRLMALVVGPGYDYHWYRHQRGGFWGHKPGSTAARNWDNSGNLVTNPETADRGPYTDFCGYFYAGRSVVIS